MWLTRDLLGGGGVKRPHFFRRVITPKRRAPQARQIFSTFHKHNVVYDGKVLKNQLIFFRYGGFCDVMIFHLFNQKRGMFKNGKKSYIQHRDMPYTLFLPYTLF